MIKKIFKKFYFEHMYINGRLFLEANSILKVLKYCQDNNLKISSDLKKFKDSLVLSQLKRIVGKKKQIDL